MLERRRYATAIVVFPDGTERTLSDDYRSDMTAEGVEFMWTEGNDSCDCNRRMKAGMEPGPCGDTIKLVSLTLDGVRLYPSP